MRRHKGSGRFSHQSFENEDINPMEFVANLADVMLVFACGLMLALITYWNVDVGGTGQATAEIELGQEITDDVSGLDGETGEPLSDSNLQECGKVYRDPATGQLYMVTDED
jgi:hypothetical protein